MDKYKWLENEWIDNNIKERQSGRFEFGIYNNVYKKKSLVRRHIKEHFETVERFICGLCDYYTIRECDLQRYISHCHKKNEDQAYTDAFPA